MGMRKSKTRKKLSESTNSPFLLLGKMCGFVHLKMVIFKQPASMRNSGNNIAIIPCGMRFGITPNFTECCNSVTRCQK